MRKLLPTKQLTNAFGFTLIELLVVVSIIAILSIIGIAIFTGVQKQARDARRTSDVDAIAAALETTYRLGTYQTVNETNFSSGKVPNDPINEATTYQYSFATSTDGSTPISFSLIDTSTTTVGSPDVKYFIVCAKMEDPSSGGSNSSSRLAITTTGTIDLYCRRSQQ